MGGVLLQIISKEARKYRLLSSTPTKPLDSEGEYETIQEAKASAAIKATSYIAKNPGEDWHRQKRSEALAAEESTASAKLKPFYRGKSVAHLESELTARALKHEAKAYTSPRRNPKSYHNIEKSGFHRGQYVGYGGGTWKIHKYGKGKHTWIAVEQNRLAPSFYAESFADLSAKLDERAKMKENPIAIFGLGNPPKSIKANVEGVVYNRCLEVRAEKTGKFQKGLWRHPFSKKSQVQILALDNGDLLLHSTRGVKLWKVD